MNLNEMTQPSSTVITHTRALLEALMRYMQSKNKTLLWLKGRMWIKLKKTEKERTKRLGLTTLKA